MAALLEDRAALLALRRALPRGAPRVVACRTIAALERHLEQRLTDAIVLDPARLGEVGAETLRARYPEVPVVVFADFRPDAAAALLACVTREVAGIAVGSVDDAILGELVLRVSLTARRRSALAEAPRALRLDEPIQRKAWERLVSDVDTPVRTGELARRLGVSREHLSRQFGAGGAPNLKRVIDLTRIAAASQLLRNPGYNIKAVVRLLSFSSPTHLNSTAGRIAGVPGSGLARLGPRGVLIHFAKGKTRSRGN